MKIFDVEFTSSSSSGIDVVVCETENEIVECLIERGYKNARVESWSETNSQRVRVKDLTAGDLIKLIKN